MSKYHRFAKYDWTTAEGIAAGLDGLELEGYGAEFQIFRDGVPINEGTARRAIVDKITAPAMMEEYRRSLRQMMAEGSLDSYVAFVRADPAGELVFEHGDPATAGFRRPVSLDGFEIVFGPKKIEQRLKHRTKREIGREEEAERLRRKLDDTQNTDDVLYLLHANQCGYLVRNTTMRFWRTGVGQRGTSTMTQIEGIALPKLQEFIDSAGKATLSMISTHIDPDLVKETEDPLHPRVTAMHSDFAKAIVAFLDMEGEVDIDGIKRQYGESESDSQFQSIEHWGGDRKTVLGRLTERRKNLDPAKIEKQFALGYKSGLRA